MKLVILLLCLGWERYLHIGGFLCRFHWLESYTSCMSKLFRAKTVFKGWLALLILYLPILLIVGVTYYLTKHWYYEVVGMVSSFIILLYCLGPDDLYHQLQNYFNAKHSDSEIEAIQQYQQLTGEPPAADQQIAARKLTKAIFVQANERFFGVIFWFIVLGPLGALAYRLTVSFRYQAEADVVKINNPFLSQITLLQNLLDWIPARITILLYMMVGNFHGSFTEWWARLATGLESSQELVANSGVVALNNSVLQPADLEENKQALQLVDRALIVVLVMIAIFTLGQLI